MQELNYSEVNNRVNTIVCYLCGREYSLTNQDSAPEALHSIIRSAKSSS